MRAPMIPPSLRGPLSMAVAITLLGSFSAAFACFNSDDRFVDEEQGTTTGETYGQNPTTTESADDTTTGEIPEADCEDAIDGW